MNVDMYLNIVFISMSFTFVVTVCVRQMMSVSTVIWLTVVTVSLSHIRVLCPVNNKTCKGN